MRRFSWITITLLLLSTLYVVSVLAEEKTAQVEKNEVFQPEYTLHGNIEFSADSYFGDYPVITEANRQRWVVEKDSEYSAIMTNFSMDNPTRPNLHTQFEFDLYANPLPEVEAFAKLGYKYDEMVWEQFYLNYGGEKGIYTIGLFPLEMGALGLLLSKDARFSGLMAHTKWKHTWVTAFVSQPVVSKDYYFGNPENAFPYLSESDDYIAGRFSWQCGKNLLGLNLLIDGFDDEKGLSLDFNGKVRGHSVTAELGAIYPSSSKRDIREELDIDEDTNGNGTLDEGEDSNGNGKLDKITAVQVDEVQKGFYPGMVMSVNLMETPKHLLQMTLGGMTKGFCSLYGTRAKTEMEDAVKFGKNTWGGEVLYQLALKNNWILGVNLVALEPIDQNFFEQYQKHEPFATRRVGLKIKKQVSTRTEISASLHYLHDCYFDYGKAALKWKTVF